MRFIADENVEYKIVSNLRNSGHDVVYVAEISPSVDDDSILKNANDSDSILITNDKDFGELVFRQNRISEGVILLRLDGLSNEMKVEYVLKAIEQYNHLMTKSFTVIAPGIIRIRKSSD